MSTANLLRRVKKLEAGENPDYSKEWAEHVALQAEYRRHAEKFRQRFGLEDDDSEPLPETMPKGWKPEPPRDPRFYENRAAELREMFGI
jgi:hypothetical protein